jgi:uncharacterized protein involved in cysteine biosynthesis
MSTSQFEDTYAARYKSKTASSPNLWKMVLDKWGHYLPLGDLREFLNNQPAFNGEDFITGIKTAYSGFFSSWRNPKIQDTYWGLIRSMGASMLVLYSLAFVGFFFLLPLLVFFPSFIFQILSLIPLWSFNIAKRRNPLSSNRLFLDELYKIDPKLADTISSQMPANQKQAFNRDWVRATYNDARTSWHFAKLSAFLLLLSAIPVVGSILSFVGNYYLVADKLGWEFLSIYTHSVKRMDYKQTKDWMHSKKWAIIGFSLPWALLGSIPFGGPLLLGYAQAASAHLFANTFGKEIQREAQESVKMTQG